MKGIVGNPYIDCSPAMEDLIERLDLMNLEICSGIALSNPSAGVYGPGIMNSEKFGNFLMMKKQLVGSPEEALYRWNQMSHNQQNTFAKLYLNLYNPSSVVYLRQNKKGVDPILTFMRKGHEDIFEWTPNIDLFPNLTGWLHDLKGRIFQSYGRALFFIHEHDCKLLIHRDGISYMPHRSEFIWFNPKNTKKFFIYDEDTDERHYVNTSAAFFNDLDMHGGDATPNASWSLRIDGIFTDEFRKQIGIDGVKNY